MVDLSVYIYCMNPTQTAFDYDDKDQANTYIQSFYSRPNNILREINLAISDKAGCLSDLLTEWEII